MEIEYWPKGGAMTDYLIHLDADLKTTGTGRLKKAKGKGKVTKGLLLGVSVTRAMTKPSAKFGPAEADRLLRKKLKGVVDSTLTNKEGWSKQVDCTIPFGLL
ncbi:unnamed protein product [Protopolystoma xenopodis]|uniref:Uncharacterized protein n=1 Tax=Protopolystoma xenopodis TaxID=117903 RepID=A0A3S5CNX1_9PLAT|nr:unnamed protein product [Protopolystoma xenopodis]